MTYAGSVRKRAWGGFAPTKILNHCCPSTVKTTVSHGFTWKNRHYSCFLQHTHRHKTTVSQQGGRCWRACSPLLRRKRGKLCLFMFAVRRPAAGRVEPGVSTFPGQTGQHLLLDLLSVAVLALGRQEAAHALSESFIEQLYSFDPLN